MLAILFLFSVVFVGFTLTRKLNSSFIVGSIICVSVLFILTLLIRNTSYALCIYAVILILYVGATYKAINIQPNKLFKKKYLFGLGLILLMFLLFQKTFSYDKSSSAFLISSNLYQDYGAHIPNIRYFSQGGSLPEVPFFSGGGLLYHFMFDFYSGILEFLGLRIDIGHNLISAASMVSLLFLLFEFSSKLFKNKFVGFASCALFIFGSDLSFIQIIQKYGLDIYSYYHNSMYVQGEILGLVVQKNFLSINTFLNQRHLIFGIAVFIFVSNTVILDKFTFKKILMVASVIGLMPFWHISATVSIYIILLSFAILLKDRRYEIIKITFFSLILTLPQLLLIKNHTLSQILLNPGFLIHDNLTVQNFFLFWIWNLGFAIPFLIFGIYYSNPNQKKILIAFVLIFFVANLFKFSNDIFDNHKYFNIWIISIEATAAYGLYKLFVLKKKKLGIALALFSGCILIISGVFNFLVVKNDVYARIQDASKSSFGTWVVNNTSSDDIFMSNAEIYDPVSIIGRRVFLGRAHFIFTYGGDAGTRLQEKNIVFSGSENTKIEKILNKYDISYLIIHKSTSVPNVINTNAKYFEDTFKKAYEDENVSVYKI